MRDDRIVPGSVVQVNEQNQSPWRATLLIVRDVKEWGIQGFTHIPYQGDAYIRLKWEEIDYIGQAVMIPTEMKDEV